MSKSILITGGCGFIGTNFVEYWFKQFEDTEPVQIVNLDLLTYAANNEARRKFTALNDYYYFVHGSINYADLVTEILETHKPYALINFAAESHVDNSIEDPYSFVKTNVDGTFTLLECSRKYYEKNKDFRFIHISTDEVYGTLSKDDPAFTEETNYKPNSPYSASKAASDHLVRAYYHTYGLPTITTNCSNNYGPYQHKEKFIPTIIRKALAGKDIPIYGDGEQIRDWLYVEDHCKAIKLVLEKGRVGETYNIGGDCERNNLFVANLICGALDLKVPLDRKGKKSYSDLIKSVTDRPGHDRRYAINFNKIKKELGWIPEETFLTGINKTLEYYIANGDY